MASINTFCLIIFHMIFLKHQFCCNIAHIDYDVFSFNRWKINIISGSICIQLIKLLNIEIQTWRQVEILKLIKLCVHRGYSPSETNKMFQDTPLIHTLSRNPTFASCPLFKECRESLKDHKRSGRRGNLDAMSIDTVIRRFDINLLCTSNT